MYTFIYTALDQNFKVGKYIFCTKTNEKSLYPLMHVTEDAFTADCIIPAVYTENSETQCMSIRSTVPSRSSALLENKWSLGGLRQSFLSRRHCCLIKRQKELTASFSVQVMRWRWRDILCLLCYLSCSTVSPQSVVKSTQRLCTAQITKKPTMALVMSLWPCSWALFMPRLDVRVAVDIWLSSMTKKHSSFSRNIFRRGTTGGSG